LKEGLIFAVNDFGTSKNMLDHIGEAESTKSDLLLDGITGLFHVCFGERSIGLNSGVHSFLGNLKTLCGPLGNIDVLPLGVRLRILA